MTYDGSDFEDMPSESRIREVAKDEVFKQAQRFQVEWQTLLRNAGWYNNGETINSITLDPQREGSESYAVGSDRTALLISEFGRRPGAAMPPEDPLAEWVNEQAGMPSKGEDDFDNVVFLVRRSIAENGIEPIAAGRRAFEGMGDEYEERVARRLSEDE